MATPLSEDLLPVPSSAASGSAKIGSPVVYESSGSDCRLASSSDSSTAEREITVVLKPGSKRTRGWWYCNLCM